MAAPLNLRLVAIVPDMKRYRTPPARSAGQRILQTDVAAPLVQRMGQYPAQLPTPYRRTGTLGRGWTWRAGPGWVEVYNRVGYSGFVQGFTSVDPRQTAIMRQRNWQRLDEQARIVLSAARPALARALLPPQ